MKIFSSTHEYPHTWQHVTLAHWQKYPNPCTQHVLHADILNRHVDPETGVLVTERLIAAQQKMPSLIRRLIGGDEISYAYEITETDPRTQTHTSRTVNLTYSDLLRVEETCTYRPTAATAGGEENGTTEFRQEAKIMACGAISRFAGYLEEFSVKKFGENAATGRRGLEQVLDRLIQEGQGLAAKVAL